MIFDSDCLHDEQACAGAIGILKPQRIISLSQVYTRWVEYAIDKSRFIFMDNGHDLKSRLKDAGILTFGEYVDGLRTMGYRIT